MLNDTRVRTAKACERPIKLSDSGGLYLLIQPHGSKLWRLAYRFGGKQKTLAIGVYPTITLRHAREKRDEAKGLLAANIDPSTQRRLDKLNASTGNTFRAVAEEVLMKLEREGRAEATLAKQHWLFRFAYPAIGDRPIAEITAPEVLSVLRKVEARGRYETARRLRSTCGMVFRYAIATGRAQRDPSVDLRGALTAPKVAHRSAIVDPASVGALLRAIEDYDGLPLTKAALKLAPLVFVRPGELRKAEWAEFDIDHAEWRIPPAKMKMRRLHRVPLSKQALEIIHDLRSLSGDGRWVFPSVRSTSRPMSENTLNAALRRLGYSKEQMTAHGFKGMASTRLNEMGRWSPDAIERQLAHQESNDVRRAYMHAAEYWPERVKMMQTWADYLDELKDAGKVVPLRRENA
ncbi:MAG: integrase arm-type DNA-binding domain-containing protein [Xanthobacteraceae bacterium]